MRTASGLQLKDQRSICADVASHIENQRGGNHAEKSADKNTVSTLENWACEQHTP